MRLNNLFIIFLFFTLSYSQTDKMYIGDIKSRTVTNKNDKTLKTIKKVPFSNNWVVYGKYDGVNWETGEINFYGNDGKVYSNPSNVIAIYNKKRPSVHTNEFVD